MGELKLLTMKEYIRISLTGRYFITKVPEPGSFLVTWEECDWRSHYPKGVCRKIENRAGWFMGYAIPLYDVSNYVWELINDPLSDDSERNRRKIDRCIANLVKNEKGWLELSMVRDFIKCYGGSVRVNGATMGREFDPSVPIRELCIVLPGVVQIPVTLRGD